MHCVVRISRILSKASQQLTDESGRRSTAAMDKRYGMAGAVCIIDSMDWSGSVTAALREVGLVVLRVQDEDSAGRLLRRRPPDHVVVVDDRPNMDALELLPWLSEHASAPVTVITEAIDENRVLECFATGADDVVSRDCRPAVFVARVRALLRRTCDAPEGSNGRISIGDVAVEENGRTALVRGRPVHLTPLEFALLYTLMHDPGVVYSREDLLDSVWGSRALAEQRTIDAHIWKLRRKIEPDAGRPHHIISVPGLGYRFRRPDEVQVTAHAVDV